MNKKKLFVSPKVIQEVQVQLEKDFLDGSVQNALKVREMGIDLENYDFSEGNTDGYTLEWYE